MAAVVPSVLPDTAANAATSPSVPVAGVLAFGIGAGQLGSFQGGSQSASPAGLAFDAKGDLFAADPTNNRVIEYTPSSPTSYPQTGTVVAGAGGQGSGLNQLSDPNGVALDAAGDLFVADSTNNRVVEYPYNAATGSYASSGKVVAGTGTAGSGLTQLSGPQEVALDASGDLFVADYGNNRVEEFGYNAASGSYAAAATTVAGAGGKGSGASQLDGPDSVTLDAKRDLFVADRINGRVMEYAFNAGNGTYAASGTQVAGSLPSLAGWVTLDASGDLFVSYGYLGSGGVLEFSYNSATGSYASTGTAVASADQLGPSGLAFNPSGDLFVGEQAQTSNPSQTIWDLVLEFTYNASAGTFSPLGTIMSQSGRMNQGVSAVAVDSHGNLFASDGAVYEFPFNSAAGTYSAQGTQVAAAGDVLALDSRNDLFVASPGTAGALEYPWNAAAGSYPSSGQAVPGASQLSTLKVTAMALDAKNDLFVATSTQVLEFPYNASAGTYAASGTVIATVAAGGLALDTGGDLFVSNPSTSQVQEYLVKSATGAYASTGITVAGTGGNGSGTSQLSGPTALAVDRSGDLFVFDAGNARVMDFTGNQATGAYAANGVAVFTGSKDNYPETGGVALDSKGDVFYTDNYSSAGVYESVTSSGGSSPVPSPWSDADVGSPATAGSASYADGVFTVNGGGADIWGGTDQFNYVSQPLTGNASIVARVTSQTDTDPWAKAGVMIKQSTASGSSYALLGVTPGNGVDFQDDFNSSAAGGSYSFPNAWLKLTRSGSTITAYSSPDGTTWTPVGAATISLTDPVTIGLFNCAHNASALNTATFDNVSVTAGAALTPPPSPWSDADVGSPATAGSASYASGVFTVNGGGSDIWGSTDQFNYVSQPLTGDATIVARVTSQTDTDGWAKAGVMIKQSTASDSDYALLAVTPGTGIAFQDDFNSSTLGGSYSFPNAWLKLTRSGSTITAYSSPDGTTWTQVGTATIPLTDPVTIGLFDCAHNASALNTATFDNVSVTSP